MQRQILHCIQYHAIDENCNKIDLLCIVVVYVQPSDPMCKRSKIKEFRFKVRKCTRTGHNNNLTLTHKRNGQAHIGINNIDQQNTIGQPRNSIKVK